MRCSIVMAMHCYSRYRSRLSPHAVFNAGGAVSVITALRKNRRVERCNLHNERVAMELDAVTAQTSDRRPAPRVWIARVQLGDASNTAARCMRLPIACRLCVGAATSVACEGDGARFAIDCAAFGAADKRSPLSGSPRHCSGAAASACCRSMPDNSCARLVVNAGDCFRSRRPVAARSRRRDRAAATSAHCSAGHVHARVAAVGIWQHMVRVQGDVQHFLGGRQGQRGRGGL